MNTQHSTLVDERHYQHPPSPVADTPTQRLTTPRKVTVVDRAALYLGLALITWSRRQRVATGRPACDARTHREHEAARERREQQWLRTAHLTHHWR